MTAEEETQVAIEELELLDYDIDRLERRLASTERAPFEWRWTGTPEAWEDMCAGLRARIGVLREEREQLAARLDDE